jgi:hypothetical protein
MKVQQIKIVSVGKAFAFGEVVSRKKQPETVYIPWYGRKSVSNPGTKTTEFGEDFLPYIIEVGQIIMAEIVDGNEKYRKVSKWAPEPAWTGKGEVKIFLEKEKIPTPPKTEGAVRPAEPKKPAINLLVEPPKEPRLDPQKDGGVVVRVRDQNGKQLEKGYGPFRRLLSREADELNSFAEAPMVEAELKKGIWTKVQNPFKIKPVPQIREAVAA